MTPSEEIQDAERTPLSPGAWIGIGILIAVVGAFVTAATGDIGWLILAAVPASVMLWIGVIAKGVEVGLRHSRRE